jgi:hypothetical protein
MGVTVNYQVRWLPIHHGAQLAIPEHPVFGQRLRAERAGRRRKMGSHDTQIGIEDGQRVLQGAAFAVSAQGEALERT